MTTIKPQIVWTTELAAAAHKLGKAMYDGANTIPERGRELATYLRVGRVLTPEALDCVAMLRSRMHSRTEAEDAFNIAWAAAWDLANVKPGDIMGSYDPALKPRDGELATERRDDRDHDTERHPDRYDDRGDDD